VIAPGAKVQKLAGGFAFTEGPSGDARGDLFFTDQPNDRIMRWSADGQLSTFLQPAGRSNGLYFDHGGNLIACADKNTALWSIAPDRTHTVLCDRYADKPFNGPNDVWVRPDGGLYFSDPFYPRPWWSHASMPQDSQQVYFLSADRRRLTRVTTNLVKPNGITGTPDGRTLFVSDIEAGATYRFDVATDGSLFKQTRVIDVGSDGMTLDDHGHLYLTGDGVMIFNTSGRLLERIAIPEKWTANVAFSGKDRQTLFVTATTGLYAIRMRVKGANAAK
jgi:gluconolactonase